MSTEAQQSRGDYVATREYHADLEDPARLETWARTSRITDALYARERADRIATWQKVVKGYTQQLELGDFEPEMEDGLRKCRQLAELEISREQAT